MARLLLRNIRFTNGESSSMKYQIYKWWVFYEISDLQVVSLVLRNIRFTSSESSSKEISDLQMVSLLLRNIRFTSGESSSKKYQIYKWW